MIFSFLKQNMGSQKLIILTRSFTLFNLQKIVFLIFKQKTYNM